MNVRRGRNYIHVKKYADVVLSMMTARRTTLIRSKERQALHSLKVLKKLATDSH